MTVVIKIKRAFPYILALLITALFLFLRFYKIQESLLFFNDIGRDYLVLWKWQQTGKPPLLGPQTSALPFNQSAIYFYALYPFYLLTGGSEYATLLACALFYVLSFLLGLYLLRYKPQWRNSLLLTFFLIAIQPQYIIQGRFIWNPSFVTPFVVAAVYLFLALIDQFKQNKHLDQKLAWLLAFCLTIATSLSYSAAPTLMAFLLVSLLVFRWQALGLLVKIIIAGALVNLGTIAFEFRHGFLLTKMMFNRQRLPQETNWLNKLQALNDFSLASLSNLFWPLLLVFVLILAIIIWQKKFKLELKLSLSLFLLTLIITLVAPIGMQAHYIFGILPLIFMLLSFLLLANQLTILIFLIITLSWLRPEQTKSYFAPAYRSVVESNQCARNFCQSHQEPLFVAVQSDRHPYHNGMEWQYLVAKNGCQLKDLTTETDQADHLAVFVDDSNYEHGSTAFNELTIFGNSQEIEVFECSEQLQIHYLEKISD